MNAPAGFKHRPEHRPRGCPTATGSGGTAPVPILVGLLGLALLAGCSRGPSIAVRNQSGTTLSNVLVLGNGFTNALGNIPPRSETRIRVRPSGDSALRLQFEGVAGRVDSGEQGYVEANGSYEGTFVIRTNLEVHLETGLGRF